jgi:predicted O-methyltransferase YrrM
MLLKKILLKLTIITSHITILLNRLSNYVWYNFPFGSKPLGSKKDYQNIAEQVKNKNYPEVENYERNKNIAIDKQWLDNLALHTQITIKKSELCYAHGRVLYTALSSYLLTQKSAFKEKRITVLETGTARGFSALCMAKALADCQQPGLIMTFDVLPHFIKMYWNCIDDNNGPRTRANLLNEWKDLITNYIIFHQGYSRLELPKVQTERIHFAFLDGAHTYEDVIFEFNQIKNRQLPGDIIVYDDYSRNQFPGIVRAVDEICYKYNYLRTDLKATSKRGYVITVKK